MKSHSFSRIFLASAFSFSAWAIACPGAISLTPKDFSSAHHGARAGQVIVSATLSESGKAKFKSLNESSVEQAVHADIGGVETDFTLRTPITGDDLEMGPYSAKDAEKVVAAINRKGN